MFPLLKLVLKVIQILKHIFYFFVEITELVV